MESFDKSEIHAVIERIKFALELNTDRALADILGISYNTINMWKRRGNIDFPLIYNKLTTLSLDWIFREVGEPFISTRSVNPIKNEIDKLHNYIQEPLKKLVKGSALQVSEPILEYKKADSELLNRIDTAKIPYYFSSVKGGERQDYFNELKGYWQLNYLVNERTIAVEMRDDNYESIGLSKSDYIIIDTVRKSSDGDVILAKRGDDMDLMKYIEKDDRIYIIEVSEESEKKSFEYDGETDIFGVVIARIKNYK